jgi:hypothetical protein
MGVGVGRAQVHPQERHRRPGGESRRDGRRQRGEGRVDQLCRGADQRERAAGVVGDGAGRGVSSSL